MASLKDIADELGVSVSLVSKVLNDRMGTTGVRADLLEAIQAKAAELGYRKNTSAVALRQGRHDVIGVFVHRAGMAGSGIMEELLEGISTEAMKSHLKLLLNFFHTAGEFAELSEIVHHGVMDGLVMGGIIHPEIIETLVTIHGTGLPIVTVHDRELHDALPNVGIDQVKISRIAAEHLVAQGCRRIAHIHNRDDRTEGYRLALDAHGVEADPRWIYNAEPDDYGHTVGAKAVRSLLEQGIAFDGFLAQSDQEGVGAINALFAAGHAVPGDVRVVGIDNAPYCEFARVPLSSVSQNYQERGRMAVEMLQEAAQGGDVKSVLVEPELYVRESTA